MHVLVVHAVVVLVPLAALMAVVSVFWLAARRRLGVLIPLVALAGLVCVPMATQAGEWLRDHVAETAAVSRHAEMGDGLLPWAGLLFLLSLGIWLLDFAPSRNLHLPSWLGAAWIRPAAGVAIVAVAVVAVVQVYRIGDSGAKAAWQGRVAANVQHGAAAR